METSLIRVCDGGGEIHGTGFVLSDSLAVTCAHVVEKCGAAPGGHVGVVFHANQERHEAEVLAEFWCAPDGDDIAVLRFEGGMPPNVIPVQLGRTSGTDGHRCATLGYPRVGALQGVEGRGEIYQSVFEANGRRLIQLASKEITTGFSGAPLLDQVTGRVVGMITEIAEPDRHGRMGETAFAIPADVLHQLLRSLCPDLRLHPPQAVEDYLKAVAQFCRDLPYVSLRSDVPLETVYVRQQIRQELKEGQRTSDEETRDEELAAPELRARPMTVVQALEQHPRLVVMGGPGAGKSTLLRHLVQGLAEETGDWHPHLPILISLQGLAERKGDLTTSLREQVQAELGTRLLASLPENFLTDWARQTEMPWLIALDGLDEIVDADRRRLLIRELKQAAWPTGSHVLITTRPGTSADLDGFTAFDLLPFEPEQVEEFAHNWFKFDEAKARAFMDSLQAARLGDLSSTPLLLTVAATVFEKAPETGLQAGLRRSRLFAEFVRILLAEDAASNRRMKEQFCQQFRTDLGERLFEYRREVMESTALALQEGRAVRDTLIESLKQVVGWSDQDAARKADDVLKILAQQRVGLVVRRGDRYEFIHPSFRERLAAAALVQACGSDLEKVWERAISRWSEENWREVALFALGVLSDESKDVTLLLEQIWEEGESGLYFSGTALADQVRVADDLASKIINALLAKGRRMTEFSLLRHPNALEVLSRLGAYAPVIEGLLALARNEVVAPEVRREAVVALRKLGRADDAAPILLTLAHEPADRWVRLWAVEALRELGRADDLLTLAHDPTVERQVCVEAAAALGKLGRADDAAPILLTLAHNREVQVGLWAVKALKELGQADDLLALAQWAADPRVQIGAASALRELGRADDAVPILLTLARKEWWGGEVRQTAAMALGSLGRVDDLLALARDETIDALVRVDTVWALRGLGRADALLALARDETVHARVRRETINALGEYCDARSLPDLERIARLDTDSDVRWAAQKTVEQIRQRISDK